MLPLCLSVNIFLLHLNRFYIPKTIDGLLMSAAVTLCTYYGRERQRDPLLDPFSVHFSFLKANRQQYPAAGYENSCSCSAWL